MAAKVPFSGLNTTHSLIVCYAPTMITTNGIWQGDNPLQYSLPLFVVQVVLVVLTTRALVLILKPFRQPRVIAEIIGGILLGPSVAGRLIPNWEVTVFPTRSVMILETMAHIGLLFFLFLVGVEMDVRMIKRTGRKSLVIALAGMFLPFIIGTGTSLVFKNQISTSVYQGSFLLFIGVALSVTAFPVLARILAETKLINTELGRIAMSAAVVNDACAWILLALAIALSGSNGAALSSLWVVLSATAFVLVCFYAVRPVMWWVIRQTPEGEAVSEIYVCFILMGVMVSGLITDAIGIHSVFGAFVYGLVIPNGPLGLGLIEKLEDFVTGLLLPLFFAISGFRTDIGAMQDSGTVLLLVLIFLVASVAKVAGTILISLFYTMPFRDGLSLGFLMNTKGLMEMIVLNIGRDKEVLDRQSFAVMVVMSIVMTSMVTPVIIWVYRPARRLIGYKRRNLQRSKPDTELRMLTCVHSTRNVPTIISLLEVSHPTKRSPIFVYALHLVELTGRASAMLIVHDTASRSLRRGRRSNNNNLHRIQAQSEHIISVFESYEQHAGGVSVQPLTAVSPYSTMHEDICGLAEDKRVALLILPFHKHQTVDGGMDVTNPAIRTVNQNVLANAPCSVAILVDRGLNGASRIAAAQHVSHHVALLFFGGPDDREALAYTARLADHPGINLTVVRFLPGGKAASTAKPPSPPPPPPVTCPSAKELQDSMVITIVSESDREQQLDDEQVSEFRLKNVSNESVVYMEKVVKNSEETVLAIRSLDSIHDLYIVGKGQGMASSTLTAGLTEWSECPELGPIGDLLASTDSGATASVLVVQQYVGPAVEVPQAAAPESPGTVVQQYLNNANQQRGKVATGTHQVESGGVNSAWNGQAWQRRLERQSLYSLSSLPSYYA